MSEVQKKAAEQPNIRLWLCDREENPEQMLTRLSRASKRIHGMEAIAASGECVNSTILSIHPTV